MGLWQKTLFYLGLVDEDEAATHAPGGMPGGAVPLSGEENLATSQPAAEPAPGGRRVEPSGTRTPGGGRRVEPSTVGRRRMPTHDALAEAGVVVTPADRPLVRTVSDSDLESEVITARSYSDAQLLADHMRANFPVVLDLRKVEPAMVRRLVDFASGLTYALGGSMRKIGQGVILVTPANVNISRDERRRLGDLGYYQAPEEA